ncbi:MAG: GntR family transcriptional regulator [Chloroflexota bacterium]|nr:GntR family transcriptional regulator [Chloroflexia bacterium]MDQ3226113.1 GntR family transcriptional regulator [Chloroflexota bacterium]
MTFRDWPDLIPDRQSPVPLYYQLAAAIRERIRAGALTSGDQLPAERELAERAGISRMTARQALADLARGGDVVARHGVGTFVAEPKLTHDALHLLGFTEEMGRAGGVVHSRVLEQAIIIPPAAIATALDLQDGEETVRIVRLRSAAEIPLLLEMSLVPRARCPGLEHEDLERQSLYAVLELRYGYRPRAARQTIEATVASVFESELLEIAEGTPLLVLEGITTTDRGVPIEWFQAIYRADRVKIVVESQPELQSMATPAPMSVMLT